MAFGAQNVLYRRGCDDHVYVRDQQDFEPWSKIDERKAYRMSASRDSLWIVDNRTKLPYKFVPQSGKFQRQGNQPAKWIQAGLHGQAVMRAKNNRLFGWHSSEQKWASIDNSLTYAVASGEAGRLYNVDLVSKKLFE